MPEPHCQAENDEEHRVSSRSHRRHAIREMLFPQMVLVSTRTRINLYPQQPPFLKAGPFADLCPPNCSTVRWIYQNQQPDHTCTRDTIMMQIGVTRQKHVRFAHITKIPSSADIPFHRPVFKRQSRTRIYGWQTTCSRHMHMYILLLALRAPRAIMLHWPSRTPRGKLYEYEFWRNPWQSSVSLL